MSINFSVEVMPQVVGNTKSGKALDEYAGERSNIKVFVPFIPDRKTGQVDTDTFVGACEKIAELGYVPVPHFAPRHIKDEQEARQILEKLANIPAMQQILLIAGDPKFSAVGEWQDTIEFLHDGLLNEFTSSVLIAGHPEGHFLEGGNVIPVNESIGFIRQKIEAARVDNLEVGLATQFAMSMGNTSKWLSALQNNGADVPVNVGVMGPATLKQQLKFAQICGLGSTKDLLLRQPTLIPHLLMRYLSPQDPIERVHKEVDTLAELKERGRNIVGVHFYPFANLGGTMKQIALLQNRHS